MLCGSAAFPSWIAGPAVPVAVEYGITAPVVLSVR